MCLIVMLLAYTLSSILAPLMLAACPLSSIRLTVLLSCIVGLRVNLCVVLSCMLVPLHKVGQKFLVYFDGL